MKKKRPIYEIDINYACVSYDESLVSLISFINDNEIDFWLEEKDNLYNSDKIRLISTPKEIYNQINKIIKDKSIPQTLLFVYDKPCIYNEEFIYIKEIFTGVSIKVDKTLVDICRINKYKANIKMLSYNLENIENIKNMMISAKINLDDQKIIPFEKYRRMRER